MGKGPGGGGGGAMLPVRTEEMRPVLLTLNGCGGGAIFCPCSMPGNMPGKNGIENWPADGTAGFGKLPDTDERKLRVKVVSVDIGGGGGGGGGVSGHALA